MLICYQENLLKVGLFATDYSFAYFDSRFAASLISVVCKVVV